MKKRVTESTIGQWGALPEATNKKFSALSAEAVDLVCLSFKP